MKKRFQIKSQMRGKRNETGLVHRYVLREGSWEIWCLPKDHWSSGIVVSDNTPLTCLKCLGKSLACVSKKTRSIL